MFGLDRQIATCNNNGLDGQINASEMEELDQRLLRWDLDILGDYTAVAIGKIIAAKRTECSRKTGKEIKPSPAKTKEKPRVSTVAKPSTSQEPSPPITISGELCEEGFLRCMGHCVLSNIHYSEFRVKLAFSSRYKTHTAIKIMPKSKFDIRELKFLDFLDHNGINLLKHDHILSVYEYFTSDKCLYLVMEYVQLGSLHDILRRAKRFPELKARDMYKGLVSAVKHLHGLGIYHRYICCENIYVFCDMVLKLGNFRCSGNEPGWIEGLAGSVMFTAPEVFISQYDGKVADMWSMGVVLYCMLVGVYPYCLQVFDDIHKFTEYNYELEFPRNVNISVEGRNLLCRFLTLEHRRITILEVLQHPWLKKEKQSTLVRSGNQ